MISKAKRMLATIPTSIMILALLSGTGLAAWYMLVSDQTDVTITSGERLTISGSLETLALTAEGNGASGTETIAITNSNGDLPCVLSWTAVSTDVDTDDCTDYENDLDIDIKYQGTNRTSGETVTLGAGANLFTAYYEAVEWSCPQDVEVIWVVDCS